MNRPPPQLVDSLDDPRVAPYRNLKDRELARLGNRFIAEGELVVRRLLDSDYSTESVFLAMRRVAEIAPIVPPHVPVYAAPQEIVNGVLGYRFHSGVMAVGLRKPPVHILDLASHWPKQATLVVCPNTNNTENLGAMIRIAAGFGASVLLLGPESCDPFYRQSVRVSMGSAFRLPIAQSADLLTDLQTLRDRHGVQLIATALGDDSQPLALTRRADRVALLFGNEAQGLPQDIVNICEQRVMIPMSLGTDSLNVAISAGIVLYHYTQVVGATASPGASADRHR